MASNAHFFTCQVTACDKRFRSMKALVSHMNLQHSSDKRLGLSCNLDGCSYVYDTVTTFRCHVARRHRSYWDNVSTSAANLSVTDDIPMDVDDVIDDVSVDTDEESTLNSLLNNFAKYLAFLKLKILEENMLPVAAATSILNDMQVCFDTYHQEFIQTIRNRLHLSNFEWKADAVLRQLLYDNSVFERCRDKFESEYLFSRYLAENMKLNSPVLCKATISNETSVSVNECLDVHRGCSRSDGGVLLANPDASASDLKNHSCKFHYVPILQTLKTYLQQSDIWASCQHKNESDGNLHNFTDGRMWQNSTVNLDCDMYVRIHLYSDEFELCNPLGSRKGEHKVCAFYFLVGNLETKYWSSLSNIHLAMLCKYKHVKNVGYKAILEPLLADIKVLETEGIIVVIDSIEHRVFGTVVTLSGDNLTSHMLGGFNGSFSSGRICRHCMATKAKISDIFSEEDCTLRSAEGHAYHVKAVENDSTLSAVYGVKYASPFVGLTLFDPVTFFPPDVMHDVLEGLMAVIIAVVVKYYVRSGAISLKVLNYRISNFCFGISDKCDKFGPFPLDFVSKDRATSGKAVEKWCLFRLLPLLIGDVVDDQDKVWQVYILAREITDIVMAPVVDPAWLPYLELIIAHHHTLLRDVAPKAFIPKMHFIVHYPRLMLLYGPLRHLWTMRFEAVHQYFKQLIKKTKNFVNVTASLCSRFQRRKCYELAANALCVSATIINGAQHIVTVTSFPPSLRALLMDSYDVHDSNTVLSVRSVTVNGQKYKVGCMFVCDVTPTEEIPVFVFVKHIIQVKNAWLICGIVYDALCFNVHCHAYEVETSGEWVAFGPGQMHDYQCLSIYQYMSRMVVIMRHRVCKNSSAA